MRIMLEPRKPVKEERELMYQAGYDPSECLVVSRLNGIMTIYVPGAGTSRINEVTKREMP